MASSHIVWDMDSEEAEALKLPTSVTTTVDEVEEAADPYADDAENRDFMLKVGEWLTSTYDSRLSNFDYSIGF